MRRAVSLDGETFTDAEVVLKKGVDIRTGERVKRVQDTKGRIWLLTIYAKSVRENISSTTLNMLRELADHADID